MVARGVPVQQQFSGFDDPLRRLERATGPRRPDAG
jgi:hypothetical protein